MLSSFSTFELSECTLSFIEIDVLGSARSLTISFIRAHHELPEDDRQAEQRSIFRPYVDMGPKTSSPGRPPMAVGSAPVPSQTATSHGTDRPASDGGHGHTDQIFSFLCQCTLVQEQGTSYVSIGPRPSASSSPPRYANLSSFSAAWDISSAVRPARVNPPLPLRLPGTLDYLSSY